MATKKKAVAAPKREQDKKAIRLVEKTIKSLDKFIERVSLGTSRSNPSIRAAHGKQVKSLLLETFTSRTQLQKMRDDLR